MHKTVIFFVLAGLGIWSIAQASPLDARILQDHGSSITLEFQLNDYTIEPIQINGNACSKVLIQGQPPLLEKGMPELPVFVSSLIIPNDARMDYRIIDIEYETIKIDPVVPSKGNLYRNINPADIPYTFAKFYQTNTWWPEKTIELDRPFILRDYRGLSVRFNPFQFNPATKELKIAKRVIIEVYETGKSSINVLTKAKNIATHEFVNIYDDFFLNFRQARYDSISERAGRMVIICADAFMSNMESFKTWKRMKGIETKMVTISSIGNNETAIKTFIQNEYNAGDLVWVLLVGDGNEVVPATGNMGSANGQDADPVYAYTAGGDYYPDLFISRFSSRSGNAINIDKQASRSIEYEKTPQTGANWYHIGLGIASNQGSPPDNERCNWLRDSLLLYYYTSVDSSYDPWGTSAIIKSKIEAGTGIINYIGHGSTTSWSNGGGFSISDINSLNNPWLLPFVISVACLVGNFNGSDCYCEASVTAGTVSDPDGFLVHWGSTISQTWVPPCYGQEGAVNLLTHNRKNTAGGIFFNGACYMIEHYGSTNSDGIEMAQTWHIFGDGSVQLRTNTPASMTVNHAAAIFLGQTTFDVSVPGVQNALVGLYIDTLLVGHGYTNAAGNVTITLDPSPSSPGTMYITVTAYNRIPYLGSVPITSSSGPYIALGAQIIDDASGGNNDGVVNPGETIDYGIYGKNVGTSTAFSVYGLLSESDPYVSLSIDSSWYGNIAADDSLLSSPYYQFTVATNCPNNHGISFSLEFHDIDDTVWTATPSVIVYAPELTYQGHAVVGGNGNGILDPGETADLVVTIENEGGQDAVNITSVLRESSPYITLDDSTGDFGNIPVDSTRDNAADPYTITASVTTPIGTTIDFTIHITGANGYTTDVNFSLVVGAPGVDYVTHDCGNVKFTVTRYGALGYMGSTGTVGEGFCYPISSISQLYYGAFAAGNSASYVVDRYYESGSDDVDWETTASPDGMVRMYEPGPNNFDEYTTARYIDSGHPTPQDLVCDQYTWAWDDATANDFVIMKFVLINEGSSTLSDLYGAVFMDWDIGSSSSNYGSSEAARNLTWMYATTPYVGVAILDPPRTTPAANLVLIDHALYVYPYSGLPDNIQIQFMDGTIQNASSNRPYDWSTCNSAGPFTLDPGGARVVAFAILGGDNLSDLQANADTAYNRYWNWPGIKEEGGFASLPLKTLLGVMYPNPGLGVMSIRYQVAGVSDVSLCVYDAAGRLVRTIVDRACEPGCYTQVWDSRDDMGRRVPAGVYFVRLQTDDYQRTEKAVLLR